MAMPRSAGGSVVDVACRRSRARPSVISSSPAIIRSSVDLPQPEGPTKTTNSLGVDVEVDALDDVDRPNDLRDPLRA